MAEFPCAHWRAIENRSDHWISYCSSCIDRKLHIYCHRFRRSHRPRPPALRYRRWAHWHRRPPHALLSLRFRCHPRKRFRRTPCHRPIRNLLRIQCFRHPIRRHRLPQLYRNQPDHFHSAHSNRIRRNWTEPWRHRGCMRLLACHTRSPLPTWRPLSPADWVFFEAILPTFYTFRAICTHRLFSSNNWCITFAANHHRIGPAKTDSNNSQTSNGSYWIQFVCFWSNYSTGNPVTDS